MVGQRVVIRCLVPGETGPSGGPALTDLLGICTSWGGGVMTLAPADGAPVEIALADIVSGKPVPPRPSHLVRVSARDAELHGVGLVSGVATEPLGEWLLRSSPDTGARLLKRANSCLAMGSPGRDFNEALGALLAFYDARGRAPMAQVELGSPTETAFVAAGWRPIGRGDASFQAAPVSRLHRLLGQIAPRQARSTAAELVEATDPARTLAEIRDDRGVRIASGAALLDGDWLCLHGLAVDPAHRRLGLATSVLAELVEWGAEHGARTAWLHVETDNAPALALYERLGFSEHHAVRYLVPTS